MLQAAGANLALVTRALYGLGTPRGWADRVQEACLALLGSVSVLLRWWRAHLQSMLAFSRSEAAWGPPGADLMRWSASLLARP